MLYGPYDWNQFPLAPPGCKAVMYECPAHKGSWGSHCTNGWYLGLSINHYCCCHHLVPKTWAYQISGSAKLFPQHCQVPCLMWAEHLKGLSYEMVTTLKVITPRKQQCVLTLICSKLPSQGISAPPALVHTHTLQEWILPANNPHCFPCPDTVSPQEQRVYPRNKVCLRSYPYDRLQMHLPSWQPWILPKNGHWKIQSKHTYIWLATTIPGASQQSPAPSQVIPSWCLQPTICNDPHAIALRWM